MDDVTTDDPWLDRQFGYKPSHLYNKGDTILMKRFRGGKLLKKRGRRNEYRYGKSKIEPELDFGTITAKHGGIFSGDTYDYYNKITNYSGSVQPSMVIGKTMFNVGDIVKSNIKLIGNGSDDENIFIVSGYKYVPENSFKILIKDRKGKIFSVSEDTLVKVGHNNKEIVTPEYKKNDHVVFSFYPNSLITGTITGFRHDTSPWRYEILLDSEDRHNYALPENLLGITKFKKDDIVLYRNKKYKVVSVVDNRKKMLGTFDDNNLFAIVIGDIETNKEKIVYENQLMLLNN